MRRRSTLLLSYLAAAVLCCLSAPASADHHEAQHGDGAEHAAGGEHAEHGGHGDHDLSVNWFYGFLGEKEGVEPSVLFRPKGMPMPVGANIINSALLFLLIYKFGKKPIAEGLSKRKARIVAGMDEAAKMKNEAASQLDMYEQKLKHLDEEIERVRREMRESAEAERQRILTEAKERRARMERDARILVEQELKAAREELVRQAVQGAVSSAERILQQELNAGDHDRLADEYIGSIQAKPVVNALGGKA